MAPLLIHRYRSEVANTPVNAYLVEGADEARASEIIREAVRPLVNEIRSSFAYLNTGDRQARVARLLLSGGGALLPGFVEMLARQLNVATEYADPTLRMRGRQTVVEGFDEFRLSAAVPIGLTLGAH